jgi:hypothetical protein
MLNDTNSVSLYINFGELQSVISWCEQNCQFDWKFDYDGQTSEELFRIPDSYGRRYIFKFDNDKDTTLFVLRWK